MQFDLGLETILDFNKTLERQFSKLKVFFIYTQTTCKLKVFSKKEMDLDKSIENNIIVLGTICGSSY